jgi:sarcosine oxidase gamma subunit
VAASPVADLPCVIHHVGVDRFWLIAFSTYAGSFVHSLAQAAAGVGYRV